MSKLLKFILSILIICYSCSDNSLSDVEDTNSKPVAFLTVSPSIGDTNTVFNFDASSSYDNEDETSVLKVRWDWEKDGIWDTDFSTIKIASHKFPTEGIYNSILEIQDSEGLTDSISNRIVVTGNSILADIDGNIYRAIKIGEQWWMVENLKVIHYRNGESIPNISDNSIWTNLSSSAYCAYDNANSNIATYGLLYNWFAVDNSLNIAPTGWHVPTDEEWKQLEMYLGMSQSQADEVYYRGTDKGGKLKESGTNHWNSPNIGATNSTGFTALPGGCRSSVDGMFAGIGYYGYWWSATESIPTSAWYRNLYYNYSGINRNPEADKQAGFSVRCVKD